jgi:hypothetical protein
LRELCLFFSDWENNVRGAEEEGPVAPFDELVLKEALLPTGANLQLTATKGALEARMVH